MKQFKFNPYLLAFFAVLAKALALTLGGWEFGTLSILLVKLSFDSWQATTQTKEDTAPLEARIKAIGDKIIQVENSVKLQNFNRK